MQQTKSYWRFLALTGVMSAFIASACVVTTSTDDNTGGADGKAGSGAAGAATGGAATAGAATAGAATAGAATAGSHTGGASSGGAPAADYQCDMGESGAPGTPNSCKDTTGSSCQKCIEKSCCTEYAECYATDPGNQCGWGGPVKLPDGSENPAGEAWCIQVCIQKGVIESGTAPDSELVGTCGASCATSTSNGATQDCGSVVGTQTNALIGCMMDNCSPDCFGPK